MKKKLCEHCFKYKETETIMEMDNPKDKKEIPHSIQICKDCLKEALK